MYKKLLLVIILASLTAIIGIGCKKGEKRSMTESPATAGTESQRVATTTTPYDQILAIFKGFEDVVEKNKTQPVEGVRACKKYAQENIPRIKSLESNARKMENNPEFLAKMIETNKEIKEISDNITKTVTESYGVDGADVLLQLSDMSLARLEGF